MDIRTGRLRRELSVLTIKHHDQPHDQLIAGIGSPVEWNGTSSNKGYEYAYGGEYLMWGNVYHDGHWWQRALREEDVRWDK